MAYDYVVGDIVNFDGSNWRVVKNATVAEDYVTLMKERVLTNAELGEYAYDSGYDTMIYHESSNIYSTSKIREMLESRYLSVLGELNLKEIDGYKIRLITLDELYNNLECKNDSCSSSPHVSWISQNFGGGQNHVSGYWTMSSNDLPSYGVWYIYLPGTILQSGVDYTLHGVRPVINLLKSAIE